MLRRGFRWEVGVAGVWGGQGNGWCVTMTMKEGKVAFWSRRPLACVPCITYCIVLPLCCRGSVGARGYGMGTF